MDNRIRNITMMAIFPALMAATAGVIIPLFNLPPITLQTFFVYLAGLILGPKKAAISMSVYVLLGVIGLPIFSGYRGGFEVIAGFSGGFLIGFIVSAFIIGTMKNIIFLNKNIVGISLILLVGTAIVYMFGASYIAFLTEGSIWLILVGFVPYLAGDFIKIVVAGVVHVRIRSHVTYEHP